MPQDIEIACQIKGETDKAYKVFDGTREVWLPKSQISDACEDNGKIISVFIPEWLAIDKGLV